jgi:hypothetical protein
MVGSSDQEANTELAKSIVDPFPARSVRGEGRAINFEVVRSGLDLPVLSPQLSRGTFPPDPFFTVEGTARSAAEYAVFMKRRFFSANCRTDQYS